MEWALYQESEEVGTQVSSSSDFFYDLGPVIPSLDVSFIFKMRRSGSAISGSACYSVILWWSVPRNMCHSPIQSVSIEHLVYFKYFPGHSGWGGISTDKAHWSIHSLVLSFIRTTSIYFCAKHYAKKLWEIQRWIRHRFCCQAMSWRGSWPLFLKEDLSFYSPSPSPTFRSAYRLTLLYIICLVSVSLSECKLHEGRGFVLIAAIFQYLEQCLPNTQQSFNNKISI